MFPIQFGFCVPIFANPGARLFRTPNYVRLDPGTTMDMARAADALGYDSLWVADHLMLGRDEAILEGWTVLAALAGSTHRARLGMIHQGHFFRHPALVAKMTATLDQISGGRFIYFVDAGYGQREHRCYGLPYPETMEERIAHVVDGLEITLALWRAEQPISRQGKYYHLEDAVCTPLPLQQPHPPVWFGEAHPAILAACARYGQGWNTAPVGYAEAARRLHLLADACAAAGRSVDELEKSLEVQILVAPDHDTLRARLRAMVALAPAENMDAELVAYLEGARQELPTQIAETWLIGTPDEVIAQVRRYLDLGITHFLLWFVDAPDPAGLELFASEVAPRVRSA
ncbi:MAG TPA: LLM class flavin-dependent oxidoreductase [Caldilineaceae bacterium]|nr:LLM class flavin-dependent oxidoreductase [Caldilineaceae bacterium]